jgi:FixJ family two-component response regulator
MDMKSSASRSAPVPSTAKSKVAVVDDDQLMRGSLLRLIRSAGYEVEPFVSALDLLESTDPQQHDCLVVDLKMPGMSGLELQRELRRVAPGASIVFISGHGDIPASVEAMKAGAVDFLEKPISSEQLLAAIRRAITRSLTFRTEHAEIKKLMCRYESLTPRERQVFDLITIGLLNKQVAAELGNAEKTVKFHRRNVMDKMGANSLAALAKMAEKLRIRPPRRS